jgi:peptidoglycan-N-acetylglucosamine deacetylase
MDDRATTYRRQQPPSLPAGLLHGVRTRSRQSHHRRRRWFALGIVALLALIAGISAGSGGGSVVHHQVAGPAGYFSRIHALAGSGAGSLAAQETVAENAAIDRTLAYTPYVRIAGAQHREIALTFDDGPGPYTPQVLSVLLHKHVPGTFFEVGVLEKYFHDSTAQIVARGYPIGDHTESHAPMSKLSAAEQRSQLLQQVSATGDYGAPFPRLFRPPYGLWDNTTLSILKGFRMLMIMWTVDTSDYREPGVAAIVQSAVTGARPGAIILMHDAGGNRTETVEALPIIIHKLRARGYHLVTVPRLLLDNPPPANQQLPASLVEGN